MINFLELLKPSEKTTSLPLVLLTVPIMLHRSSSHLVVNLEKENN
jgi:hypothetical protein